MPFAMFPGSGFVVVSLGLQASMQDPHHPVCQLSQRGMVTDPARSEFVVVAAGTGRGGQCCVGLAPECVHEAIVVHVSGEDVLLFPARRG